MAEEPVGFRIVGAIRDISIIARGRGVRVAWYLRERYRGRRWRKMKGVAYVEEDNGYIGDAEVHWYEAHGVGRVEWKIKERLWDW